MGAGASSIQRSFVTTGTIGPGTVLAGRYRLEDLLAESEGARFWRATDTVLAMVKQLRRIQELEKIKELNDRLQYIEGEADKLMLDLLRDLYSGRHESLKVIVLKDLYELLERIIDRCRDAGNVIIQIVLKST